MKLNLGCGNDVREGYTNVDFLDIQGTHRLDLSALPWPWSANSVEEILMLDFLEHFSYRVTDAMLREVWRVLEPGGRVVIQVPDFEECATAAIGTGRFHCNGCGHLFEPVELIDKGHCSTCFSPASSIQDAAIFRLYGGQDRDGNWHYTAFTKDRLERMMRSNGFENISFHERNENGETFVQNWNFKLEATKKGDLWDE